MNEKFKIFLTYGLIGLLKKKQLTPEEEKRGMKRAFILWGLTGVFLLALAFFWLAYFSGIFPVNCTDLGCFITKANQCASATYQTITGIGTINYSVKSVAGGSCVLTKQLVKVNPNENAVLKKVLENKQLECIYAKGQLNGQWFISMIEGLDNCDGDLKDVIGQLLLLVDVK